MSKIDDLIEKLCPDGVEFKRLGDIVNILDNLRKPVTKKDRKLGIYPYYGANGIQDFVDDFIFDGVFILMGEDGSVVNKDHSPVLTWAEGKIWVNNHAHILSEISEIALLRFIYFSLQASDVSSIVRGTPPKINQENLKNIELPVPPLPVQHEIVRILDKFTTLEAELEAELEKRKKQYEYYKKSLLSQLSTAIVTKLGEVATLKTGSKPKEIFEEKDKYEYINAGTSNSGYVKYFNCEGDTVTTPSRGQGGIGYVGYQKNSFWLGPLCYRINSKDTNILLNRYLYHYLSCFNNKIMQYKNEGGTPSVNASDLVNIAIEIPLINEQQRIITFLDRFDTICNDLNSGLPAEIEARRKQYEYYRDKLLTFKEKES